MANEGGIWIMRGPSWGSPGCMRTIEDICAYIEEVGFLPLFANEIGGFSVEDHVAPEVWWSGDERVDPWMWREIIAGEGKIAYGKFFDKKAGFISKKWLPYFANFRRDGYDFDSAWDEGLMQYRYKAIMDMFAGSETRSGVEVKGLAGFGKQGLKNFDGCMTWLQMRTYLSICRFECKVNKKGMPYGMPIAYYRTPETSWGSGLVTSAYGEDPQESKKRIYDRIKETYPLADDRAIKRVLGKS